MDSVNKGVFSGLSTGPRIKLELDNRDFPGSPSVGTRSFVTVSKDWGSDKRGEYTKFEFDHSQYLPLPNFNFSRQQTIAANIYYSEVLSWEEDNKPAWFAQSSLGGITRLRGYQYSRFFGKSALYGSIEYRITPFSNIFKKIPWVRKIDIPWWQFVTSFEVGNVSDSDSKVELVDSIKYCYGFGVRALIEGVVGRADISKSKESTNIRLMVNQTF